MKKTVSILTATRAEYGLLRPLIKKLITLNKYDVKIVVTGAHLSPEFGFTFKDIEKDGYLIDEKIEMILSSDKPSSISKSMALAMISFSDYFDRIKPNLLIVLGDRYETLAVTTTAMNQRIPIAHIHGGEITEGAVDDAIRHSVTKMSLLHFTTNEEHRKRVIQLGENPNRVFNVGGLGVENIISIKTLTRNELQRLLDINLTKPYAVVTFHSVTLENNSSEKHTIELLEACKEFNEMIFIFTKSNADADGRVINQLLEKYVKTNMNFYLFTSLGTEKYLSSLKYSSMIIGNSSSGLLEAPSYGIPTINIGDRQKGRMQSTSVINCKPTKNDIVNAIKLAQSKDFISIANKTKNPYGDGNSSSKIVQVIDSFLSKNITDLKKSFFDI